MMIHYNVVITDSIIEKSESNSQRMEALSYINVVVITDSIIEKSESNSQRFVYMAFVAPCCNH